jgi:Na+-transporting NADH:ubiquinone oxidoreductase subunit NqrB
MPILRATLDLIAAASFIAFCVVLSFAFGG